MRRIVSQVVSSLVITGSLLFSGNVQAQEVRQERGVDSRVDYAALKKAGPWDDRNYQLLKEEVDLLSAEEHLAGEGIPAFFRIWLRKQYPELPKTGKAQYPRSGLPRFRQHFSGYLIDGKIYREAQRLESGWVVKMVEGTDWREKVEIELQALSGEVKISSPAGAAETAIAINPVDPTKVIAGSNGPTSGQVMWRSSDGGSTWAAGQDLPLGGECCDPTIAFNSTGTKAYTASLGSAVWVWRSDDNGVTWDDFNTEAGADPRREIGSGGVDKEYLHIDTFPTSPFLDRIYLCWHASNIQRFAFSSNAGNTWTQQSFSADPVGIGCDLSSDKNGNVYYFYPAFVTKQILVKKSIDGGTSFGTPVVVAPTQGSFIFPIPSTEVREAFIYAAADADLGTGTFANSLYAAWTDSTAATSGTAANNHARIQVAYSRDGGATWNVTTPHETADANTVDRWHPWLKVAPNGNVFVVFYDTRNSAGRTGVDFYFSVSTDGAQTWSAPARLTTVTSPNIADGFEFGDYNGMDIVGEQLIAIYTDNRNEGGGGGDSIDAYAVGTMTVSDTIFQDGFELGNTSAWDSTVP
jgi:hypothetical protein